MRHYWGIDPGKSGAIVVLNEDGNFIAGKALKDSDQEIFSWFDETLKLLEYRGDDHVCIIEKVWAFPEQGTTSAFNFGRNYGFLCGLLAAVGIPYKECAPGTWKRQMGLIMPKGSTVTERKNKAKQEAGKLFPRVKITHASADALMIAEYCRRTWK